MASIPMTDACDLPTIGRHLQELFDWHRLDLRGVRIELCASVINGKVGPDVLYITMPLGRDALPSELKETIMRGKALLIAAVHSIEPIDFGPTNVLAANMDLDLVPVCEHEER